MSPLQNPNNSTTESKENELVEKSDRDFRSQLLKMISDLKEDSNKQINEVRKSIQDLNKKVSNVEEKFSKEMEIMGGGNPSRNVRNENSNKSKPTMDSIISR
jgi:DNA-binding ferritin-like protein